MHEIGLQCNSKFKKLIIRGEEAPINENLNKLINEAATQEDNDVNRAVRNEAIELQRTLKRNLVAKLRSKIERRNAKRWYNKGELSNKYFFGLLNRKTVDEIKQLTINGTRTTDTSEINDYIRAFYKDLYESVDDVQLEDANS